MIDRETYKFLKLFYKNKSYSTEEIKKLTGIDERKKRNKYTDALRKHHFIEPSRDGTEGFSISLEGCAYVEQKKSERRNFWVPYIITTIIALISLIDTILSWFSC